MIDEQPMIRATALLSALGLAVASLAGFGSVELTGSVALSVLNLFVMASVSKALVAAVAAGQSPGLGMAVLNGKTVIVLASLALVSVTSDLRPVVLGFALVTSCFTVAAPLMAMAQQTVVNPREAQ